jgi:hypothetical protein
MRREKAVIAYLNENPGMCAEYTPDSESREDAKPSEDRTLHGHLNSHELSDKTEPNSEGNL